MCPPLLLGDTAELLLLLLVAHDEEMQMRCPFFPNL
jgi:hypothetical protein